MSDHETTATTCTGCGGLGEQREVAIDRMIRCHECDGMGETCLKCGYWSGGLVCKALCGEPEHNGSTGGPA